MTNERAKPEFVSGLYVKEPHRNKPFFIIAKLSVKREELIKWLQEKEDEWINIDIKEAKSGKLYAQVDNWEPEYSLGDKKDIDKDIPF